MCATILDKERTEKLQDHTDRNLPLKERVSKLASSLGAINPSPDLSSILEQIKNDEYVFMNAYKDICDEIQEQLFQVLSEANNLKQEAVKIDMRLLDKQEQLNKYCSIYAKVPPLVEQKDSEDYQFFLESYERGIELSHSISLLNFKAVDLLDTQKVLDNVFAGEIVEIEYLATRLKELIKSFRFIKTPQLVANYQEKFCAYRNLQELVDKSNREFDEFLAKLDETKRKGSDKKFKELLMKKENLTTGISKDIFAKD